MAKGVRPASPARTRLPDDPQCLDTGELMRPVGGTCSALPFGSLPAAPDRGAQLASVRAIASSVLLRR
jgi:hypothetical protein